MMLSRAWLVLLPFVCACDTKPKAPAFDGAAAYRYAGEQVAFGPRVPGTPAWQKAGDWIVAQMRQRADTVIEQRWTHTLTNGKGTIPMRNVLARWRPQATDRILYVTHWDSRPTADAEDDSTKWSRAIPGANDGAAGVGLFVALGDILKKTPPNVGVDLLFVDGEDYGSFSDTSDTADVLIGSTYFAKNLPAPGYQPMFGVLWDMIGDKDLQIYQEKNSIARAPEVVTRVWQAAANAGQTKYFIPESKFSVTDDHIPLLKAGLRVIDVIDIEYPDHHKLSDTMNKISPKSLGVVGDVAAALIYAPEP